MVSDENKADVRALLARRLVVITLALALVAVLGVLVWGVIVIRSTQLEGTPLGKKLVAQADRIQSCTTPGEECSVENQRQMAKALERIRSTTRDIIVATSVCRDNGITGTEALTSCVNRSLESAHARPRKP